MGLVNSKLATKQNKCLFGKQNPQLSINEMPNHDIIANSFIDA